MGRKKVVIVGGGFAGIEVAHYLAKSNLPVDITLVSSNATFQYYPNLYRLVVGATVNQVSLPLSEILAAHVTLIIDTYTAIDQAKKSIVLKSGTEVSYDFLVLAMGSEPNYFGIEGMEAHSKSFLSIDKALSLRKYFSELLVSAKSMTETEARMKLHTVIVGAGPSGVEMSGALGPYLVSQAKKVGVNPAFIRVDLLDSSPRVLPAIPEKASALVTARLKKNGVTVYSNYGVNACDENGVIVADKSVGAAPDPIHIDAGTVIWTAGTKISTAFTAIPNVVLTDRKRVQVSPTLTLPNDESVYIIGDGSGTPYSGLAQTAIDQGQYVGHAIAKRLRDKPVAPYRPKQGVFVIPVAKRWAILNYKQLVISGYAAYIIRIIVDVRYFLSVSSVGHVFKMMKKNSTYEN